MTHKEEIREAASGIALNAVKSITTLNNFILELTAPESSPMADIQPNPQVPSEDGYLVLRTNESSPAPSGSQEELWNEAFDYLDDIEHLKSKFILTRRTEGSCPCDMSPNCDCCTAGLQTLHEAKEFEL